MFLPPFALVSAAGHRRLRVFALWCKAQSFRNRGRGRSESDAGGATTGVSRQDLAQINYLRRFQNLRCVCLDGNKVLLLRASGEIFSR